MWKSKKLLLNFLLFGFLSLFGSGIIFAAPFDSLSVQFPENTELRQYYYKQITGSNKDALSVLPEWMAIESTGVRVNFFTKKELNEDDLKSKQGRKVNGLSIFGQYSLTIYLTHYLFL